MSEKFHSTVVELQEKIMFQQRALDELNSVVLQQQSEIIRLGRELKSLRSLVQQSIEQGVGEDLPHEKPPHY
ncbi:MAG: SlyX family protein [Planctomycetes bacterium]|nr:SlyX family protein [Planctomycetota bacterium]